MRKTQKTLEVALGISLRKEKFDIRSNFGYFAIIYFDYLFL